MKVNGKTVCQSKLPKFSNKGRGGRWLLQKDQHWDCPGCQSCVHWTKKLTVGKGNDDFNCAGCRCCLHWAPWQPAPAVTAVDEEMLSNMKEACG